MTEAATSDYPFTPGSPANGRSGGSAAGHPTNGGAADPSPGDGSFVLLVGFEEIDAEALTLRLRAKAEAIAEPLLVVGTVREAAETLRTRAIDVLVIGSAVDAGDAFDLVRDLDRLVAAPPLPAADGATATASGTGVIGSTEPVSRVAEVLVLAAGDEIETFFDLVTEDRITYLSPEQPTAEETAALVSQAARRAHARRPRPVLPTRHRTADLVRRLAFLRDNNEIAELVARAARELTSASRAYCLLYHPADETLRGPMPAGPRSPTDGESETAVGQDSDPDAATVAGEDDSPGAERCESAAVGLVSFVLRSGVPVLREVVGDDRRYDQEADDPLGSGAERFAAVPVEVAEPTDGRAVAVIAVLREATESPFSSDDVDRLRSLATQVSPHLTSTFFSQEQAKSHAGDTAQFQQAIFRRSAVDSQLQGLDDQRDPLRVSPGWTRWSYWLLLAIFVVGVAFSLLFKVHDYAGGPALVQLAGRTEITARAPGTVNDVLVAPGDRVREGQVLLGFHDHQEAADLRRIDTEFRLQLARRLRDPSDPSAEQALIALRTERDLANDRLAERQLRAPIDGIVGEIRARRGQHLSPGQPVMTLIDAQEPSARSEDRGSGFAAQAGPSPRVVIALPGEYRPQIGVGMQVRLSLDGYSFAYQWVTIEAVGDEVVGANEARRILGPDSDAAVLPPSVVLVTGRLAGDSFEAEGRRYRYHDGMQARAEVRLRSERLIFALLPALRALNDGQADAQTGSGSLEPGAGDNRDSALEAR